MAAFESSLRVSATATMPDARLPIATSMAVLPWVSTSGQLLSRGPPTRYVVLSQQPAAADQHACALDLAFDAAGGDGLERFDRGMSRPPRAAP
jgi:hypothetical protein